MEQNTETFITNPKDENRKKYGQRHNADQDHGDAKMNTWEHTVDRLKTEESATNKARFEKHFAATAIKDTLQLLEAGDTTPLLEAGDFTPSLEAANQSAPDFIETFQIPNTLRIPVLDANEGETKVVVHHEPEEVELSRAA